MDPLAEHELGARRDESDDALALHRATLGLPWNVTLDCSAHAPGLAVVFGRSAPAAGQTTAFGELLVGGSSYFVLTAPHASSPTPLATFLPPVDVALLDLPLHLQGLCTGAPSAQLSNALDVIVGRW